jgi:hypothetical protein
MQIRVAVAAGAVMASALVMAQGQQRPARGTATVEIGGKKVSIDYGRPQLKGRALADLMIQLPADRIWRAGENEVTTLTTEADLTIGGKTVAAGKYSLYVHAPEQGDWALVLNSDPGIPLGKIWVQAPPERASQLWPRTDGYDKIAASEVVRATMTRASGGTLEEAFTIRLSPRAEGALLEMAWGDQRWSLGLKAAK